jgi:hypothetical protein
MSVRGLRFFRLWTRDNIDLSLRYRPFEARAHVLAAACRLAANTAGVGLQEIEDEIGELEAAVVRALDTREQMFLALQSQTPAMDDRASL